MRFKIESRDGRTTVTDLDTGKPIVGVMGLEFVHANRDTPPHLCLHILVDEAEIDAEAADVEIRDVTSLSDTARTYRRIPPVQPKSAEPPCP